MTALQVGGVLDGLTERPAEAEIRTLALLLILRFEKEVIQLHQVGRLHRVRSVLTDHPNRELELVA
jgi:hypothetical protein